MAPGKNEKIPINNAPKKISIIISQNLLNPISQISGMDNKINNVSITKRIIGMKMRYRIGFMVNC